MSDHTIPVWEQRFRAPVIVGFDWSPHAPDRIVYLSTESGAWQVHGWDATTGHRRQVTDHPVGITTGVASFSGDGILWFQDETGDESGRWLVQPFEGGDKSSFLEGLPQAWTEGLSQAPGVVALGLSDRDGFAIYVAADGQAPREIYRHRESVRIGSADAGGFARGGLSADGSLLCLEHSEHGDLLHTSLRVIDPRTGATAGEQHDEGLALTSAAWSPVPGDHRLAIVHEQDGDRAPAIWNLDDGTRTPIRLGLPGAVDVWDWWPDGSAILVANLQEGRHQLLRYDLATSEVSPIDTPPGTIRKARVRPDGTVWYLLSNGHTLLRLLDESRSEILRPQGEPAPPGRPFTSWHFPNPHDQVVHGFYVTPEGSGPWPVIMYVHGGPTAADTDLWTPDVQAFVDAGFAVGMVNYRGSTGYGREWRDTLVGNIGGPEVEDVNAGLADLVRLGIADPSRAVIAGWSWGGYITLMELGKHPELWICGVAGVPVGDYESLYDDLSPLLQAYDRALLGGTPSDVPDLMRDRNPINFVDEVRAPVLFLAGENDTRCPIRQVMLYVEKLRERDHPHELYLFSTGHGSYDLDEEVNQFRLILDWLDRHVPATAEAGAR